MSPYEWGCYWTKVSAIPWYRGQEEIGASFAAGAKAHGTEANLVVGSAAKKGGLI